MPRAWGHRIDEALEAWKLIGDHEFYFRKRSVIMARRSGQFTQYLVFHSWYTTRTTRLHSFSQDIIAKQKISTEEVIGLAKKYEIPFMGTSAGSIPQVKHLEQFKKIEPSEGSQIPLF